MLLTDLFLRLEGMFCWLLTSSEDPEVPLAIWWLFTAPPSSTAARWQPTHKWTLVFKAVQSFTLAHHYWEFLQPETSYEEGGECRGRTPWVSPQRHAREAAAGKETFLDESRGVAKVPGALRCHRGIFIAWRFSPTLCQVSLSVVVKGQSRDCPPALALDISVCITL